MPPTQIARSGRELRACHCTTIGGEFNPCFCGRLAGYAQEAISATIPARSRSFSALWRMRTRRHAPRGWADLPLRNSMETLSVLRLNVGLASRSPRHDRRRTPIRSRRSRSATHVTREAVARSQHEFGIRLFTRRVAGALDRCEKRLRASNIRSRPGFGDDLELVF